MLPGRFTLGVGTGENLNEHVTGARWPAPDERIAMLEEAIEVVRLLWQGGEQTHRGKHYTLDHATLYTLPEQPIPIAVAAARPKAAELAGRAGDGLISTEPNEETVQQYRDGGGDGPRYGQVRICWAKSEDEAKQTVFRLWRHSGLGGTMNQELPRPSDFDAVAESVTIEMATEGVPCGARPRAGTGADPDLGARPLRPDRDPPSRPRPVRVLPLLGAGAAAGTPLMDTPRLDT